MTEATETPNSSEATATPTKEVDKQNGISRPKSGTKTGRVWEIADELSAATNAPATRKDVLVKTTAESINSATAATQYGRWRKYHGLGAEPKDEPATTAAA